MEATMTYPRQLEDKTRRRARKSGLKMWKGVRHDEGGWMLVENGHCILGMHFEATLDDINGYLRWREQQQQQNGSAASGRQVQLEVRAENKEPQVISLTIRKPNERRT
jgi:hypothetical protein